MHAATEQDPVWSLYCRNIYNFTKIIYMMFTATFFNKSMKERKKERQREREREREGEREGAREGGREGARKEGRKERKRKNELEAFSEQGSNY